MHQSEPFTKAQRLSRKFITVDKLHRQAIDGIFSNMGIHRSQHMLLMLLSREGFSSQKHLAEHFDISPAAVTVTLKKLEKAGLVSRTTAQSDSRRNEIAITESGKALIEKTDKIFKTVSSAMFDNFSDNELTELDRLLEKAQGNLKNFDNNERTQKN